VSHTVLFVCTGNYYRSRYAELLFNALRVSDWQATSRGLALSPYNQGPIWPPVLERLQQRGLAIPDAIRAPLMLQEVDLERATYVIALNEPEHRPLMQQRFPEWVDRITYWQIPDVNVLAADLAFDLIEREVTALTQALLAR
jgi:Protein-tyrosine-phosphatase